MAVKRPIEEITIDDSDDEDFITGAADLVDPPRHAQPDDVALEELELQQVEQAIALSLQEDRSSRSTALNHGSTSAAAAEASSSSSSSKSTIPSQLTERQQLERERLERQRLRNLNAPASSTRPSLPRPPPPKRSRTFATLSDLAESSESTNEQAVPVPSSSSNLNGFSASSRLSSTRFWSGAVRRVRNSNSPDLGDGFSFAELLAKDQKLEMAIVGAYCLQVDWVCSYFDPETPLLLFLPLQAGESPGTFFKVDDEIKPNTFRVVPEMRWMPGSFQGSMHTKLMVYYYKSFCRVVIPTANCMDYDWHTIDNAFYVHDFPLLQDTANTSGDPRQNPTHTPFSRELLEVMKSLNITKKFITPYRQFDFSRSADVRLIATTQGIWKGFDEMARGGGGMCALAEAVRQLTSKTDHGRWHIEYQGSSISVYRDNWLAQFYGAACGIRPERYFRTKTPRPPGLPPNAEQLPIKIVYPTSTEVLGSFGGVNHGGTIFCPSKTWASNKKFAKLFHKGQSKRDRVTAHTKTIVALRKPRSNGVVPASFKHEGYVYVGSHNFGPSAWGALQLSGDQSQLRCNNYELGVLIPIRADSEYELEAKASELATYRRPTVQYGLNDVPWMQDQYLSEL